MTFADVLSTAARSYGKGTPDPRLAWIKMARDEQLIPPGAWRVCYFQGGRGSGKTRAGAGGLARWVLDDPDGEGEYGIIGPTYADAWTKCVEGKAGILRALGTSMLEIKDGRSKTVRSAWRTYGQVVMRNGVIIYIDSAAEGGLRIQGRNLKAAWADEIGLWDKWDTAWNESLRYAVREGISKIIATGTPKASRPARRLVRALIRNDPGEGGVVVRKLRTIDNAANLSDAFLRAVVGGAQGTRLERQELEGELLDDVANALWTRDLLDGVHCGPVAGEGGPPFLVKTVIGVDPSDGSEESDEQAYTVAGLGPPEDGHLYVAENWGGQEAPAPFAKRCIRKAIEWDATLVVEKNHGGAWLREVFAQAQRDMRTSVRVHEIHASQAKRTRAEPVSLMYERYARDGRPLVLHCHTPHQAPCNCEDKAHPFHLTPDRNMPELEDQMATFTGAAGERSPDRLDSMVWAATPFLRSAFGEAPGRGGKRDWAAWKEIEQLAPGESAEPRAARRMREIAGAGYRGSDQWDLDGFTPADDNDQRDQTGRRNNVRQWR
jgi:phage terminase large subunit-like protein